MKFLLTSSGIKNPSIADALAELLGKPVSESRALFVPTGVYPFPGGAASAWEAITGKEGAPLTDLVYVGVSAGSIAVTPYNCDAEFDREFVPDGSDMGENAERALGLVEFTVYPHLNDPDMEDTTLATIATWASTIPVPTYAIDDETAIMIVDGAVTVVSEGEWALLEGA